MSDTPTIPDDWAAQGWTAELAHKKDEPGHSSWGESGPLVSSDPEASSDADSGEHHG
jgi:hypothetical protein